MMNKKTVILYALILCLILFASASVLHGTISGKELFREGKRDLEEGRAGLAVQKLTRAQAEYPLLEDYILFSLAEAYRETGAYASARETLQSLLKNHPQSPLRKKALLAQIRITEKTEQGSLFDLYEAYTKEYPDDDERFYTYGQLLRKAGARTKAKAVFKKLYVKGSSAVASPGNDLSNEDITTDDMVERAASLIKRYDFDDAERLLRNALASGTSKHRSEIQKYLAEALFKQKKYAEAAEVYARTGDLYGRTRSLYRAGDREAFDRSLNEMVRRHEPKAGTLLISVAADKRRERNFEKALEIYDRVLKEFPSENEEALWGMGWTYFLSGHYQKASGIFSDLYDKHADPKYRYWEARSLEAMGRDARLLYAGLKKSDASFYGVLAAARNRDKGLSPASDIPEVFTEPPRRLERVEALLSLDMRNDAITELVHASKKLDSSSELLYVISTFNDLGEYRRSIRLASKIPVSIKIQRYLYPLAFWDSVKGSAQKYHVDPYIILSVMREESRFDTQVKSPAGAYGLMQLMPSTAYRLDKSLNLGISKPSNLTNAKHNIALGSYYLRSLMDEFPSIAHVLAAYNAGEIAVRRWQQNGPYVSVDEFVEEIPYLETRNYVKKVITAYHQYRKLYPDTAPDTNLDLLQGRL